MAVECSPRLEDNQWVLDVAANEPVVVGLVGFLDAGKPGFGNHLERFARNPVFRGIRYGNLWGRDLTSQLQNPQFLSDMQQLADADLSLDTANPNPDLLEAVLRLSDRVPSLRIIVDHLPKVRVPADRRERYQRILQDFSPREQLYVKISSVLDKQGGEISHDVGDYRSKLDEIVGAFGEDRILYGSDWPNSEPLGNYAQVLGIVQAYFADKGREVQEKYFRLNSQAAYRWKAR